MKSGGEPNQATERLVTIRFPQVDPAGIIFYPRYFELVQRYFPDIRFGGPPAAIKTRFLKPNRLGDRIHCTVVQGPGENGWSVSGSMNGQEYFSMRPFEPTENLAADFSAMAPPVFRTRTESLGEWACGISGHMHLSRYFEYLNMAIEEWFEETLEMPFHELHVGSGVGIPTVQFKTQIRNLPSMGDKISIGITPTAIGVRAMTFRSWLLGTDERFIENEQVVVFVRMLEDGYESIPIPSGLRQRFESQVVTSREHG
jgi:acyl-CoA thioesterase FadM